MLTDKPTQVRRPWRATVRTIFQAVIGFAAMWAVIVEALGLDKDWQWVSASLVATAAITRVMALPQVEAFLTQFAPWLAADPNAVGVRDERGRTDVALLLLVGIFVLVLLMFLGVTGR